MSESARISEFKKSQDSESFVEQLNRTIGIGEQQAVAQLSDTPPGPTFLVVGAPRSGTTLLMQWCMQWHGLAVPTNLLARFYSSPYIGSLIQQMLTDPALSYRNELAVASAGDDSFASVIGKTDGLLSPHEFFYFWRQYFPLDKGRSMTAHERSASDPAGFRAAVAQLHHGLGQGVVLKAILLQYEIAMIAAALPESVFLCTMRDEVANCESLLAARRTVFGSEDEWFSVVPPGAEPYQDADAVTQVAAQVALTNDSLRSQLALLPEERVIIVDHERFCEDPTELAQAMMLRLDGTPYVDARPDPAHSFSPHRRSSERSDAIQEALDQVRSHRHDQ